MKISHTKFWLGPPQTKRLELAISASGQSRNQIAKNLKISVVEFWRKRRGIIAFKQNELNLVSELIQVNPEWILFSEDCHSLNNEVSHG